MRAPLSAWGRLNRRNHELVPLVDRATVGERIRATALPAIAHGNGRSYGDEALNGDGSVWLTRGLDRFIAFNTQSGVIRCEAGVTLEEIIAIALPHGWFLPVTPGTQFATLAGAIANDVHGKNHHAQGTIGEHLRDLTLVRTDGSVMRCAPDERADWLAATVGGMGLTGMISDASLQLRRVPGPWVDTVTRPFDTLDDFFALSAQHVATHEYAVAWIDCMRPASDGVRGAFFAGNHSTATDPLPRLKRRSAAWLPPVRWVTPLTTRTFNSLYFQRAGRGAGAARQSYGSFFYPLDGLLEWNRMYGAQGFYQYQCVVPEHCQRDAIAELLDEVTASAGGSFLSVLKTFGARPALGLMSFPMAGTTLALDFANRGEATLRLFERLDAIVGAAGGRIYPAKDASMSAALFRRGYPRLEEFAAYRDPGISSEMSRRLMGH